MKNSESKGHCLCGRVVGVRSLIGRTALPLLLGFSLVSGAAAGAAFEQLPANGNDTFPSISAGQSADDFVLPATTSVTHLRWWGSYSDDPTNLSADDFSVRLSADDGSGRPEKDPTLTITQKPTSAPTALLDITGAKVYRYDLDLQGAPVPLAGGTKWYLSVVNQFDVGDPSATWYWLLSDAVGDNFYRAVDDDPWSKDATGNFSFSINPGTPIPLPGTLILLLSGLAGLGVATSSACAKVVQHQASPG